MAQNADTPVIVGAAQYTQRVEDPHDGLDPIGMMERALRDAAEDAGAPSMLPAIEKLYVPRGTWRYGDPARLVADRVGATGARSAVGIISGHIVQVMLDRACAEIAAGTHEIIAIVGGESENSRRRLQKQDPDAIWDDSIEGQPDFDVGSYGTDPFPAIESLVGALLPSAGFALCDTSLRASLGETPAQHRERISQLAARLSTVASNNPYAWMREPFTAEEIRDPSPNNRMVNYPYTKLMTSNISVDQSSALIVCSERAAQRYGIQADRRVYLRAAAEMSHETFLSEREELHRHPGMDVTARRLLEVTGIDANELEHVDLYSCFPFSVQAGARAIGLSEDRPLSVTGGLTFSGGPFGNYVLQAIARMVEVLRESPGATGLVGSVGGTFQKFAYATYSTDPGDSPAPTVIDTSAEYAAMPTRPWLEQYDGEVTVEAYTVNVDHGGPQSVTFSALTPDGARVWALSHDPDMMQALLADEDLCGRRAKLQAGELTVLD